MWVIDQACSVKMAGYWPSSFFGSWSINTKKEQGQYPPFLTKQARSIKDLLYGIEHQNKARILSWQDGSILPAQVANHSARLVHLACLQS